MKTATLSLDLCSQEPATHSHVCSPWSVTVKAVNFLPSDTTFVM